MTGCAPQVVVVVVDKTYLFLAWSCLVVAALSTTTIVLDYVVQATTDWSVGRRARFVAYAILCACLSWVLFTVRVPVVEWISCGTN